MATSYVINRYDRITVYMLAEKVARASRKAGSPIDYYQAKACVVDQLAAGSALEELPAFYRAFYGATAWEA